MPWNSTKHVISTFCFSNKTTKGWTLFFFFFERGGGINFLWYEIFFTPWYFHWWAIACAIIFKTSKIKIMTVESISRFLFFTWRRVIIFWDPYLCIPWQITGLPFYCPQYIPAMKKTKKKQSTTEIHALLCSYNCLFRHELPYSHNVFALLYLKSVRRNSYLIK